MEKPPLKNSMLFINPHVTKWLAVALLSATASHLFAQQYTIVPNDSIVANAPLNDLTHFNITQTNLSGNTLVFHWQQIELSIPTGWTANLCDNGHCYTDFPISGTMDTVYNGDVGLMSVGIDPGEMNGIAVVRYTLWEQESPNNIDTLTWIITAGNTAIDKVQPDVLFSFYPNPAHNFVHVWANTPLLFTLTNTAGKQVLEKNLTAGKHTISIEDFPDGNYILSARNNEKITTRSLTIHH